MQIFYQNLSFFNLLIDLSGWSKYLLSRAVGRSENPGVPVVIRWAQSVPPG